MQDNARKSVESRLNDNLMSLVDLTDAVIDKLLKAEALSWLLHCAKDYPDNTVAETTAVIADLIHEALESHREQWERIRRYAEHGG